MRKGLVSCVAGAVLTLGTTAMAAGGDDLKAQDSHLTGVVTKIDESHHMLTLITPAGTEIDVTRIGKTVFADQGVDLVSVQAPVEQAAPIWRDGKQVKFSAIKEGDVVRTAYSLDKGVFMGVASVSQHQIDRDVGLAQTQLKQELKSQMNPTPNQTTK